MADTSWKPSKKKYGVAIFNFKSIDIKDSLKLEVGDTVHILEEYGSGSSGWYRGFSLKNKALKGIFPRCLIHIKECEVDNEGPYETITPLEDSMVKEMTYVFREWWGTWKQHYLTAGCSATLESMVSTMKELITYRKKLVGDALSHDQSKELKLEIAALVDWVNSNLGMDLVPRVNGEQIDTDTCSIIQLYRVHLDSSKNAKSLMPKRRKTVSASRSSGEGKGVTTCHVLVRFKSSQCFVGDESLVYFSLYHSTERKFISEQFKVHLNKNGLALDQDKLDTYYGLFTELSAEDIEKHLYIVARIYRYGKTLSDRKMAHIYRRPYGVGVVSMKEVEHMSSHDEEYECSMKVQMVTDSSESSFSELHDSLIKRFYGQSNKLAISASAQEKNVTSGLMLSFKIFHGDLQTVRNEQPILFNKGIAIIQKPSFSDIINPGEVRNDLYVTLDCADFERGNKKSQKNVEVVVKIFDKNGSQIKNSISYGCGVDAEDSFSSSVYYHNNNSKWDETFRISLPMEILPGSHIRFEIFHCTTRGKGEKRSYGFCFLKVTDEDDIVIGDKSHDLCLYKCENLSKLHIKDYVNLPCLIDDYGDTRPKSVFVGGPMSPSSPYTRNGKDNITITTKLCSTKFTQTRDLLGILKWRSSKDSIEKSIDAMMKLKGAEIIKFLQDILNALFGMLSDETIRCKVKIFQALVYVLNLLTDSRFENFNPVLENYFTETFSSPVAYRDLMSCFSQGILNHIKGGPFTAAMALKVMQQLFRLIVRSRELQDMMTTADRPEFYQGLTDLFNSYGTLLSQTNDRLKISQMALLSNLHKVYGPLMTVITEQKMAELVRDVIDKMPNKREIPEDVHRNKMEFIQETINSDLFKKDESRSVLLPLCLSQIRFCLIGRCLLSQAAGTLGDILNNLFLFKQTINIQRDVNTVVISLFEVIIQTALSLCERANTGDEVLGDMIACMTEMLRLMDDSHYNRIMQIFSNTKPLKDFLTKVLLTFQELLKPGVFPPDWTVMRMVTNNIIFTAVEYFSQALTTHFLKGESFDIQLWSHYFNLAVTFITQPDLQLESFSEAKRERVKEKYQDMRILMGHQIQMLWENLASNRRHFIPSLIGPFLQVTLVPERELRTATLPIFYDMMECEQKTSGHFHLVENELIEKLDIIITTENQGDEEFKDLFKTILLDRVQSEPSLQENGGTFIISVTNLLERLLDYRQVIDGDENRDKRMHCTFNILNFYKENINREEMYIRYIKKLFDLHFAAKNYVEAGLTLQLYAQLLQWRDHIKQEELGFHAETEWERKENLYLKVLDCFDKGKVWEYGIPLCKELAAFYEERFEYRKLSGILTKQASFFTNILDGVALEDEEGRLQYYPRQPPSYYRVAYYGRSFPPFVRNKSFIYRGSECLMLQDIINQLTQEFPNAKILKTNNPVEDSKRDGDEQFIQICSIKPIPPDRKDLENPSIPNEIKQFYNVNDVDTFQFDRSYHRTTKDKENEFKTLCTERTIMKTQYKFPGILQWYEVISIEVKLLSPIETAIQAVKSAYEEVQLVTQTCNGNPTDANIKHLSMLLTGMIAATVQGGIPKYQEAFFSNEFAIEHPHEVHHRDELRDYISKQVEWLGRGVSLMKKVASSDLQPMVKSLHHQLDDIKKSLGIEVSLPNNYTNVTIATCHDIDNIIPHKLGMPMISTAIPRNLSEIKRRSDSGIGIAFTEQGRPMTPGSNGSLNSCESNRSSVISDTISAISEIDEGIGFEPEKFTSAMKMEKPGSDPSLNKPNELKDQTRKDSNDHVKRTTSFAGHSVAPPPLPRRRPSDPTIPSFKISNVPPLPTHDALHEEHEYETPPSLPDKKPKKSPTDILTSPNSSAGPSSADDDDAPPILPPRKLSHGISPSYLRSTVVSNPAKPRPSVPSKPSNTRKTVCARGLNQSPEAPKPHMRNMSESDAYQHPLDNSPLVAPPIPTRPKVNSPKPPVLPRTKRNSSSSMNSESSDL